MSVPFIQQVRAFPRRPTASVLKGLTESFLSVQVNENFF
jgi:hypothetical protein